MKDRHSRGPASKKAQSTARNPQDQRFCFNVLNSRNAASARLALALLLSLATLAIVLVASGINMSNADAFGGVEQTERPH